MGTKEKLQVIKEIFATMFINATEQSKGHGLTFKYKSEPIDDKEGWRFVISVAEPGYGTKEIQEFKFKRPSNIDALNMEYNVLLHVLTNINQTALLSWYQLGLMMNSDEGLQKIIKEL